MISSNIAPRVQNARPRFGASRHSPLVTALDAMQDGRWPSWAQAKGAKVMAKMASKTHWSFAEDRRLIQLAASLKSLEAVAAEMKRTPRMSRERRRGWVFP